MPSNRRFKATVLCIALALIIIIYVSSSPQRTRDSPFYTRTADALAQREKEEEGGRGIESDDIAVQRRLREAADAAKISADKKAAAFHGEDVKQKGTEIKSKLDEEEASKSVEKGGSDSQKVVADDTAESEDDHRAENELNFILKRSPIIIFSKSYCPFSKKAKDILLGKYSISPPPFVVELDEHSLGAALQAQLGKVTSRKTVPNILVNGKSIGGGDDIEELHQSGKLIQRIQDLGGKRVTIAAAS